MIDLKGKTSCIFGLRGTGKSTLLNYVANHFGNKALVYDTLHEVPKEAKYNVYKPINRYNAGELELVTKSVIESKQYHFFAIDEANRFCLPKPNPLPPFIADLNDQCRHYQITVFYLARRPTQLNQDLTELADYLFIFHLKGKNDIRYLEDLSLGLGDVVLSLSPFNFVLVMPNRSFKAYSPIIPDKLWLDRAILLLKARHPN